MHSHGPGGGLPQPPTRPTATHTHIINPAVGCHYFPPGPQLPSQPSGITALRPVPSYTAWWQRHIGVRNCPDFVRRSARPTLEPATSWSRVRHPTATPRRHLGEGGGWMTRRECPNSVLQPFSFSFRHSSCWPDNVGLACVAIIRPSVLRSRWSDETRISHFPLS